MKRFLALVWLALLAVGASAEDDGAADALLAALRPMGHLQGQFTQRQYDADGALADESTGTFRLLRPGYFSWEILAPDRQLIIANPSYVWHYDRDLETLTRRPVTDSVRMSPLQVLGGDEAALREHYRVQRDAQHRFTLTPLAGDPGFRRLTLTLEDDLLSGMEILDNLGQRVEIAFDQLDAASTLTSQDFEFTPPDGVDLFYYDE
ncbi:MAG: outer membrane lipoprotein chaperone LolA [Halioglobus sp.]|nr:outer membrane lipoprotein chaperone LolA [Halioglobus sp.]